MPSFKVMAKCLKKIFHNLENSINIYREKDLEEKKKKREKERLEKERKQISVEKSVWKLHKKQFTASIHH